MSRKPHSSMKFYPVQVCNYLALSGAQQGSILNASVAKPWRNSSDESCADPCADDAQTDSQTDSPTTRDQSDSDSDSTREFKREIIVDDGGATPETFQDRATGTITLTDDEIYREYKV